MKATRISSFDRAWISAVLLALACAGCSTPVVKEPTEPRKDVTSSKEINPSKSKRELETAKEPGAPPKPQPSKVSAPNKSEQELEKGVRSYEDGEYRTAARQLQSALDLGLDSKRDQAKAHKYLGFITCVSGREKSCRDEFRKALDADPKFELEPAEAGNPIWGPALRSVKAERAAKAKSK
jgi:Tfp pilus assembly protein PilF